MQLQSPLELLIGTSNEAQNFKIRIDDKETKKLKKELDYIKEQLKKEEDIMYPIDGHVLEDEA